MFFRREYKCFHLKDIGIHGDFVRIVFESVTILTTVETALVALKAIEMEARGHG